MQPAPAPVAPTQPQTVSVSYTLPSLAASEPGTEARTQKSVTVTVLPDPFKLDEAAQTACVPMQTSTVMFAGFLAMPQTDKQPYVVTKTAAYTVTPDLLSFHVTVANQSSQALKLDGSSSKLLVNGAEVALSADSVAALAAGVVPANQSATFSVVGPSWHSLSDAATLSFVLAALPIDVDAGGNVERADFSWAYQAHLEQKGAPSTITTETLALNPSEATAVGCSPAAASAQPVIVAQAAPPPSEPELYYYAGQHFYPSFLGGEWCPVSEPHAHDFAPDNPGEYAYEDGYYYYAGRPGEVYIVGRPPVGARIHVVEGHEGLHGHGPAPLPVNMRPARHLTNSELIAHPAPEHAEYRERVASRDPIARPGSGNHEQASPAARTRDVRTPPHVAAPAPRPQAHPSAAQSAPPSKRKK